MHFLPRQDRVLHNQFPLQAVMWACPFPSFLQLCTITLLHQLGLTWLLNLISMYTATVSGLQVHCKEEGATELDHGNQ